MTDQLQMNWTTLVALAGYVAMNPPVRAAIGWAGAILAPVAARVPVKRLVSPIVMTLVMVAILANAPLAAQIRRGARTSGSTNAAGSDPALAALTASFEGTLRAVTKKGLTIELTNGNTVEFRTTKKTEFLDGTKSIQMKDLQVDAFVKVEGVKDGFGYITANKVMVPPPPAP